MIPMIRSGAFMLIGAMLSMAYSPEAAVFAAVVIVLLGVAIDLEMGRRAGGMMDLLTRIEASLEFMNDGGPIGDRVDFVNLREVLEGSREALLKLDEYEHRAKLHMDRCQHDMERIVALEQQNEALASRLHNAVSALDEFERDAHDFESKGRALAKLRSALVVERRVTNSDAVQAKLDAVMLEHCSDEMNPEQIAEWARHQRPSNVVPFGESSVVPDDEPCCKCGLTAAEHEHDGCTGFLSGG